MANDVQNNLSDHGECFWRRLIGAGRHNADHRFGFDNLKLELGDV